DDNLALAATLPVQGLHVDLVRAPEQLDAVLRALPAGRVLSLGLVDGRNIWRTPLDNALILARYARGHRGDGPLWLAPSCSLLHCPVDLTLEKKLDAELRGWLAFSRQKLDELRLLADALDGHAGTEAALAQAREAVEARRRSPRVHNAAVKARVAALTAADATRATPHAQRLPLQAAALRLPPFPTTTIGSFPQTLEVREARARNKAGKLADADYEAFLERQTEQCVREQERIGLDVLVHGEFERNDMVEYFGELLDGF